MTCNATLSDPNPFPVTGSGMTIGLLGGSFDPPHEGHVHISNFAMKAFRLDRIWWMISPGNPLKPDAPADIRRRMAAARHLVRHPRIEVTDVECALQTRFTAETLEKLQVRFPAVRFVWLMGADNLVQFHRWDRWEQIMQMVPVGVLARPGEQLRAGLSPAARRFARWRLPIPLATGLAFCDTPCWTLLPGPMMDISSSKIRNRGDWIR